MGVVSDYPGPPSGPSGPPPGHHPGTHPGAPSGKPRPSGWWFALGGTLMVAALVGFVVMFVLVLRSLLSVEATVAVDGEPHQVSVESDGDRIVYVDSEAPRPSCEVVDTRTGEEISLGGVNGEISRSTGGTDWEGAWTFDPGSGELEITCTSEAGGSIEIAEAPRVGMVVGGIFLLIAIPLVVGFTGFIIVVITGILFVVRPPRRR